VVAGRELFIYFRENKMPKKYIKIFFSLMICIGIFFSLMICIGIFIYCYFLIIFYI
jgi:hypothetical protein